MTTIRYTDKPGIVEMPIEVAGALLGRDMVYYPESDGEPMADSDHQYEAMTDAKAALVNYFRDEERVYVAANLLLYYERGDNTKRVAPDLFMARGVSKYKRSSFKVWIEDKLPEIVFEIASPGTWKKDIEHVKLYGQLQIPEYIMLDPFGGTYFDAPLLGYHYTDNSAWPNGYEPIPFLIHKPDPSWHSGLYCQTLGLEIWAKISMVDDEKVATFHFRDPHADRWLLNQEETDLARLAAEEEATEEAAARRMAEAKVDMAEAKAEEEAEARRMAETRADEAESELARLRAELERLQGGRDAE